MRFSGFGRLKAAAAFVILCLVSGALNEAAAQRRETETYSKAPVAVGPVYNPHTKSYFELRVDLPHPPQWRNAVRYARTKTFKGVRGRLAMVKDLETHSFLRANFTLNEQAWIGLRFICGVRKLVWADGTLHERKSFKAWGRQWHRTNITCRSQRIEYMGVAYTASNKGYRWQASGPKKNFVSYFIEYPTGSEVLKKKGKAKPETKPAAKLPAKPTGDPATPKK